jgi:hypothetical protein
MFWVRLNQIWIILNPFKPGTVLPRPACQPVQPLGSVAMAHRSALRAPLSARHCPGSHCRPPRSTRRRARPRPTPSISVLHMDMDIDHRPPLPPLRHLKGHHPMPPCPFFPPSVLLLKRTMSTPSLPSASRPHRWLNCHCPLPYFEPLPSLLPPPLGELHRAPFVHPFWTAPHPRFASRCSTTSPLPLSPPEELPVVGTPPPKLPPPSWLTRCWGEDLVSPPCLATSLRCPVVVVKTSLIERPPVSHTGHAATPRRLAWVGWDVGPLGLAEGRRPWATVQPNTVRLGFLIFIFIYILEIHINLNNM